VVAEQSGNTIEVCWTEQSARPVEAHERSGGQGLKLMQRILAAQDGTIHVDWREKGLEATITLPAATGRVGL
jgi:two-component sensor histidine kinase